jgi:hypothetical protein
MSTPDFNAQNEPLTFADRAAILTKFGVPAMPLEPRSKKAFLPNWQSLATTDADQLAKWNTDNLTYNCAAVGRKGGFWILDVDAPTLFAQIEKETSHTLDELDTLVVKSSGEKRHYYFKHDSRSEAMGNFSADDKDGEVFSVRTHNAYVVSAGSIHPKTGQPYEIVTEPTWGEIPTAPDWLIDWLLAYSKKSATKTEKIPETIPLHSRNKTLTSLAGAMRRKGASKSAILAALRETNRQCEVPLPGAELMSIATSIAKYLPAQNKASGKNSNSSDEPNKSQTAVTEDGAPPSTVEPRYPIEVWDGTLFQEYAARCRSNNHLPPEFFIEALKTVVGAICGHRIVPEDNFGEESRFYTTIMSKHTGDGKSETAKWTMNMMRATGLLYDSERPPLELQNIGAYLDTFASGRGMVEAFFRHPRILQYYDELSIMVEKFGITGSGASFMGLQTDMFESNFPPKSRIGGTKSRPANAPSTCHNSVLACTIKEKRDVMYAATGAENSGWFPRENLVVTGDVELVARLRVPDLTELGEKLKNKILPLEFRRVLTFYSASAQELLDNWFFDLRQRTKDESDDVKGRINVLAQRNASILAWLLSVADHEQEEFYEVPTGAEESYSSLDVRIEITEDIIRRAILLAEYMLGVRRDNQPMVADNTWAKCENIIKKHLCQRTRMTRAVLYREANLSRFGIKIVNASLLNLVQGKLICIRNKPDVNVSGHMMPMSDEEAVKLPDSIFQWMGDGRTKDDGWREARGGDRKSPYFHPSEPTV